MDPRVTSSAEALDAQHEAAMRCYEAYGEVTKARNGVASALGSLQSLLEGEDAAIKEAARDLAEKAHALEGEGLPENPDIHYSSVYAADPAAETFAGLQEKFLFILAIVDGADVRPTSQVMRAIDTLERTKSGVLDRWQKLQSTDLAALNSRLREAGRSPVVIE